MRRVTLGGVSEPPRYGAIASGGDHDGPLFVRQTDLQDGRINWDTVPRCDLDPAESPKYAIETDDLLIARLGSVGRSARVRETRGAIYAGYLVRFKVDGSTADPSFVSYQLQSPDWWDHVAAVRSGAVQPTLNAKQMAAFEFDLPSLGQQRAIAEVLGALDDKIAANIALGSTTLELADAIFAEAVPGAALSNRTFGDVASVLGGGTPRTKVEEYWNGHIRWATPTDVTAIQLPYLETTSRLISDDGLQACSSALHPPGSILMTSRATIGAFAIAQHPTAVNQGFIVVNARDPGLQWWLFHEMRARVPEFVSHANGATFLELSRGKFKQLRVRLAHPEQMAQFNERVSSLHARARAAALESAVLATSRDTLLPGLLSGKIRVKDAESVVEEVV